MVDFSHDPAEPSATGADPGASNGAPQQAPAAATVPASAAARDPSAAAESADVMCPSGRPDDPFGPTTEAPFGYYRAGEKQGLPKPNAAGRPPNRGPRDAGTGQATQDRGTSDPARVASVTRAGPRKQAPKVAPVAVTIDYESVAKAFAATWFGVGELAFGPDWAPNVEVREHIVVKDAFKRYVESKQIGDFPPGIALSLALGTYALARVSKPTVRDRLALIWMKVKGAGSWAVAKLTRKTAGAREQAHGAR
jgi:hypothetical protein